MEIPVLQNTSPQSGICLSFSIAMMGTTSRLISAIASTNQEREKGDLILL
jgi:hypothetical protein